MARKGKKKVHSMPKLGLADTLIYWTVMALCLLGMVGAIFLPLFIQKHSYFHGEDIAASSFRETFYLIFPCLWSFCMMLVVYYGPYKTRYPLVGDKNVKYGPPAYPRVYPLFWRNKPYHWVSQKKLEARKRNIIIISSIVVTTFIFSCFMFVLSIFGRDVLNTDGSITVYNAFNTETHCYENSDVEAVRLDTYRSSSRYGQRTWHTEIVVTTVDDKEHRFPEYDFNKVFGDGDRISEFTVMLSIKAVYVDLLTIEGIEELPKVIETQELSAEEIALLHQLFEVEQ